MGVATRQNEDGRGDLVILDAEHLDEGPVAIVHLPIRATGQIHGWWVPESQMPQAIKNREQETRGKRQAIRKSRRVIPPAFFGCKIK